MLEKGVAEKCCREVLERFFEPHAIADLKDTDGRNNPISDSQNRDKGRRPICQKKKDIQSSVANRALPKSLKHRS